MMNDLNTENPFKTWFGDSKVYLCICALLCKIFDQTKRIKMITFVVKHIAHGNLHIGHTEDNQQDT